MKHLPLAALTAAVFGLGLSSAHGAALDLSSFVVEGNPSNGRWNVAADNLSVLQTINGQPTAFVSPDSFINSTFEGSFSVRTTGDDDYIGFVFGFGANDSAPFFLFDWKQGNQSGSMAGFTLARVDSANGLKDPPIKFANHQTDGPGYDVLATDATGSNGWRDNEEYDFKLTYLSNQIVIEVGGGFLGPALTEIFNIAPGDAGLASFAAGRFGFFNHSQSTVRYEGFTETEVPPPNPNPVPVPAALPLLASGLGLMGFMGWRRKQA